MNKFPDIPPVAPEPALFVAASIDWSGPMLFVAGLVAGLLLALALIRQGARIALRDLQPPTRQQPAALSAPASTNAATPSPVPSANDVLPQDILLVLGAAVAATIRGPHAIRSVNAAQQPVPTMNLWSLEGRRGIYRSHQLR